MESYRARSDKSFRDIEISRFKELHAHPVSQARARILVISPSTKDLGISRRRYARTSTRTQSERVQERKTERERETTPAKRVLA